MSQNRRRGGAIAGIILTVLVLTILGVIALGSLGIYIADNSSVRSSGKGASIETPFGSLRVREERHLDPSAMGVPVYPGAVRLRDSHAMGSFHFDIGHHHKDLAFAAAGYRTDDSVERVTAFYRERLPHWLISDKGDGHVELSFTKSGYKRFVAISEEDGETRIGLASVGEPAAN